jgi:hypothetical protein
MIEWLFLDFSIGCRYPRNASINEAITILIKTYPWLFIAVSELAWRTEILL